MSYNRWRRSVNVNAKALIASAKFVWLLSMAGLSACAGARSNGAPTHAAPAVPLPTLPAAASTATATTDSTRPTNTAAPPTTAPSPTPCRFTVLPALAGVWSVDELGCPITPGAAAVATAYAPFEGGQMLWRGDTDTIYVLFNDGRWVGYPNEWREGEPEYSCGEASSPPTPLRGFGRVWCDDPIVREALGPVTAAEIGDSASAAQDFVNGAILTAPFGDPFVFVGEAGVWRRVGE